MLITPPPPHHNSVPIPGRVSDALLLVFMSLGHSHCRKHATTQGMQHDGAREVTTQGRRARKTLQEMRWTQARHRRKRHDDASGASEVSLRGRRQREGGDDAREAIAVISSLSTQRAFNINITSKKYCFLVLPI
jgi:hypothetical protein